MSDTHFRTENMHGFWRELRRYPVGRTHKENIMHGFGRKREQSWFDSHLVFVLTVMLSEPLSLIPDMLAVLPGLLVNELLQR